MAEEWHTDRLMLVDFVVELQFSLLLHWNRAASISSGLGVFLKFLIFFALLGWGGVYALSFASHCAKRMSIYPFLKNNDIFLGCL